MAQRERNITAGFRKQREEEEGEREGGKERERETDRQRQRQTERQRQAVADRQTDRDGKTDRCKYLKKISQISDELCE